MKKCLEYLEKTSQKNEFKVTVMITIGLCERIKMLRTFNKPLN